MRLGKAAMYMWPLLFGAACAATDDGSDGIDLEDSEGIEEIEEGLKNLTSQCMWTSGTGALELDLNALDVAMISKATDGKIVINGFACDPTATSTTVKTLTVTGQGGDQTLILDYMGGTFAMGTATGAGTVIDMAMGTDAVKIRGSKLADTYVFGSTGIAINTDANKDITVAGTEQFVVSMSDGNDSFTGAGNAATGNAAFATAVTVYGGAGNDTIKGGDGDDFYFGGDNDDTFPCGTGDDGSDTIDGGTGTDTVDYSGRMATVTVTLENTNDDGLAMEADNVKDTVDNIKGGAANDTLTGSATGNVISGGAGNDTIAGGGGADTLNGDANDDTFNEGNAANGADVINGGAGTDTVSYASRMTAVKVTLDAVADDGEIGPPSEGDKVAADVENVTGGSAGDTITGSALANVLDGGAGGDTISGGDLGDTIKGGDGADMLNGGNGDDLFDEGDMSNGGDTINGGANVDTVTYVARTADITVVMDGAMACGEMGEGDHIGTDVENLVGSKTNANNITGNAAENTIDGGDLADTINSLGGDDTIDGGLEDDIIDCGGGDGDSLLDLTFSMMTPPVGCEL